MNHVHSNTKCSQRRLRRQTVYFWTLSILLISATATTLGLVVWLASAQKSDAIVIDMAGRQRMLNQRHMKEVLLAARGIDSPYERTRKLFLETLSALRDGGEAIVNLRTGETHVLPAASYHDELRFRLTDQRELMHKQIASSDDFLTTKSHDPEFHKKLDELMVINEQLHKEINKGVKMFNSCSAKKATNVRRSALASTLFVFLMSIGLVRQAQRGSKLNKKLSAEMLKQSRLVINLEWQKQRTLNLNERLTNEVNERNRLVEELHMIVSSVIDGIVSMDMNGKIRTFNKAAEMIFGYRANEVMGEKFTLLVPEPFRSEYNVCFSSPLDSTQSMLMSIGREMKGRRKNDTIFDMEFVISEMRLEEELMYVSIVRDISERKNAEDTTQLARDVAEAASRDLALETKEREALQTELDHFFQLSPDMLCVAGTDGFFKRVNPAWFTTLGWTETELLGRSYIEFVHPEDVESTHQKAHELSEGWQIIGFENRYLGKDGQYRWFQWTAASLPIDGLVFAICRDITETKRRQHELQSADRLKVMIESLGAACHHLSQPLTVARVSLDVLSKDLPLDTNELRDQISEISKSVRRASQILHQLQGVAEYRTVPYTKNQNILDISPDYTHGVRDPWRTRKR